MKIRVRVAYKVTHVGKKSQAKNDPDFLPRVSSRMKYYLVPTI